MKRYLFLPVLGVRCGTQGLHCCVLYHSLVVVGESYSRICGLLLAVTSLVEQSSRVCELRCPTACGILVPRPGMEPCSPALGFHGGSAGKESACSVGYLGLTSGLGRSPGERKGYQLQYSDLENSMDCIVHEVRKSLI